MNILPKKRWHVRTKENNARVRRDQAAAAEREKLEEDRRKLAEQEARTKRLRVKAGLEDVKPRVEDGGASTSANEGPSIYTTDGHVNFFVDLERQERTFGGNKEHEKEKKAEQEEWEKKIGLLKGLADGSTGDDGRPPWYDRAPGQKALDRVRAMVNAKPVTNNLKRKRNSGERELKKHKRKSKKKKHKKLKRDEEDDVRPTESDEEKRRGDKIKQLAALRELRMQREREERARAEQVLRRARGEPEPAPVPSTTNEAFSRKYNSQFNPDLARQNYRRVER